MAEDVLLNNKRYIYTNEVRGHAKTRHSFMELAKRVYGLDFTTWYCRGYWQDSYLPHVLLDGENVVANVSVNLIRTFWNKEEKLYTQLGTVMTDEPYRKNGLSGFLLHKIIGQWENHCDAVYLYANDSVLSFYPKFGFVSADEFQCQNEVQPKRGSLRKLDINREEDKELLLELYRFSNPYSRLPMLHNEGLLMFYCSQFMRDHVYYIEDFDAVAILDYQGETMYSLIHVPVAFQKGRRSEVEDVMRE